MLNKVLFYVIINAVLSNM